MTQQTLWLIYLYFTIRIDGLFTVKERILQKVGLFGSLFCFTDNLSDASDKSYKYIYSLEIELKEKLITGTEVSFLYPAITTENKNYRN